MQTAIEKKPSQKQTAEPLPNNLQLLIARWMDRYAQIFPMYGKTLADLPERLPMFVEEFEAMPLDILDEAFRKARGACKEFPTPAEIRAQVAAIVAERRAAEAVRSGTERARLPAKPDDETPEERRAFALEAQQRLQTALANTNRMADKPAPAFQIVGGTSLPADPARRAAWARERARKNGWVK